MQGPEDTAVPESPVRRVREGMVGKAGRSPSRPHCPLELSLSATGERTSPARVQPARGLETGRKRL